MRGAEPFAQRGKERTPPEAPHRLVEEAVVVPPQKTSKREEDGEREPSGKRLDDGGDVRLRIWVYDVVGGGVNDSGPGAPEVSKALPVCVDEPLFPV